MKSENNFKSSLYELIDSIVLSAVVVLLLFTFIFRIFVVSGPSMNTTLANGERIIVSDVMYTAKQGDIICFYSDSEEEVLVKRVIATEGQIVDIDDNGFVYVDGVKLSEPYINGAYTLSHSVTMPHIVSDGCVFVLGDNRGNSKDSRYLEISDVNCHDILGKLVLRLYPNFGKVN